MGKGKGLQKEVWGTYEWKQWWGWGWNGREVLGLGGWAGMGKKAENCS